MGCLLEVERQEIIYLHAVSKLECACHVLVTQRLGPPQFHSLTDHASRPEILRPSNKGQNCSDGFEAWHIGIIVRYA